MVEFQTLALARHMVSRLTYQTALNISVAENKVFFLTYDSSLSHLGWGPAPWHPHCQDPADRAASIWNTARPHGGGKEHLATDVSAPHLPPRRDPLHFCSHHCPKPVTCFRPHLKAKEEKSHFGGDKDQRNFHVCGRGTGNI